MADPNENSCTGKNKQCNPLKPCCGSLECGRDGTCRECRTLNQPCNRGNSPQVCCNGLYCDDDDNRCRPCREEGSLCLSDDECCSDSCAVNGTCAPVIPLIGTNTPTSAPIIPLANTSSPTFAPTIPLVNKSNPTFAPSTSPTSSPFMPVIIPRAKLTDPAVTIPGSAAFVGAFLAIAALFMLVRRRTKLNQMRSMEAVRSNRKFASRKSINTFMNRLEQDKEDVLVDPQRLDLGRIIGIGSHGIVYEGRYHGEQVAVKELVLEDDEDEARDSRKRFLQEMIALHRLRHPNIINLIGIGALYSEDRLSRTFFFVMELAKCSLREIMQDDTMRVAISTMPKALTIARQVCDGLAYMHLKKLIHLDLKPENILISENGIAKICDLGLSEVAATKPQPGTKPQGLELKAEGIPDPSKQELQGTSPYIAPELITDYRPNAPKYLVTYTADIYSYGIVLWELLHAPMPTHPISWDPYRILVEVKYNHYRPKIDSSVPPSIAQIIRQCVATNPADRPDLQALSLELGNLIDEFSGVRAMVPSVAAMNDDIRFSRERQMSRSSML